MSEILATSQITIVDLNDQVSLSSYIASDSPQVQYKSSNGNYVLDWMSSPVTLTAELYKSGISEENVITDLSVQSVLWYYKTTSNNNDWVLISNNSKFELLTKNNKVYGLKIKGNIMDEVDPSLIIKCEINYKEEWMNASNIQVIEMPFMLSVQGEHGQDGEQGLPGEDAYTVVLTNEAQTIPTDTNRYPLSSATYSTEVLVFKGTTQITDFTVTKPNAANGITTSVTNKTVNFITSTTTALTKLDGIFDISITIGNNVYFKTFSWSCAKQGIDGANGVDGTNGTNGVDAKGLDLVSDKYVVAYDVDGNLKDNTNITLTAIQQNYSSAITWTTKPTVTLSGSGNTRTLAASNFNSNEQIEVTISSDSITDKVAIVKVQDGAGYAITLSNDSHTFAASSSAAIAASTRCDIIAYKGTAKINTTIGTLSNIPTGMTAVISNNNTTSAYITFNATTSLTTKSGTITIPITIDGKSFTKYFSYSLALQGSSGVSISNVDVEYYLSTSSSSLAGGSWVTAAPTWVDGKYLWSRTKTTYSDNRTPTYSDPACITGGKGSTGANGTNGSNGVGISSTVVTYQVSTSGTIVPTGTWLSSIPSVNAGQFLWTRTTINLSNNTSTHTYSVGKMGENGKDGVNGSNGAAGNGIQSSVTTYQAGTSGTNVPSGSWTTSIPNVSSGQFLWTRVILTFTNASTSTSYSVGKMGEQGATGNTGATGNGVSKVEELYAKTTDKVNPPADNAFSAFDATKHTWTSGSYIWTATRVTYTNGTVVMAGKVCDSSWEAVNEIEIGGRNYHKGTGISKSININNSSGYITFDPYTTPGVKFLSDLGFKAGDNITLSFDWSLTQNGSLGFVYGNFRAEWKGTTLDGGNNQYVGIIKNPVDTFSANNISGHATITVALTSATIKAHTVRFRIDNTVGTFTVKNLKLEKGNKATSWTPAPEDIEDQLNDKVNNTQQDIFNGLTNNGANQGIYLSGTNLYVNASMIKTGILEADRLSADTIVSKVNGASTTINGDKIATGTLSASKITTGTLDASKATITNINASNITTGTINADRIGANTITANKIIIGRKDNLVNNWNFVNDSAGSTPKGWNATNKVIATSGSPSNRAIRINGNGSIQDFTENSNIIYVQGGERIYAEYLVCRNSAANGTAQFGAIIYRKDGTIASYASIQINTGTGAHSNWITRSGDITIPSDGTHMCPWVSVRGDCTAGFWEFTNLRLVRKTTAELIVNGSITADHITANGITANKIKAGTLTATSGGSYLNLDNGSMMLGTTSLSSYLQWTGSALNIKANSINIGSNSVATGNDINTAINGLQIGSKNIFRYSGNFGTTIADYWVNNYGGLVVDTVNTFNGFNTIKTTVGSGITGAWYKLENNVEYTYSAMIKCNEVFTGNYSVPLHYWAGLNNASQGKIQIISYDTTYPTANVWKRLHLTFKLIEDGNSFKPFIYWGSGTRVFNIAYMKLEKGNKPTDWTPAPEDTNDEFDNIYDHISDKIVEVTQGYNAAIELTKNQITSNVEQNFAYKDDLTSLETKVATNITQTSNSVLTTVSTQIKQINDKQETFESTVTNYMKFNSDGLELGKTNNKFKAKLSNEKLAFTEDNLEVAYISNKKMHISNAQITNELVLGKFAFVPRDNGNTSLTWIG